NKPSVVVEPFYLFINTFIKNVKLLIVTADSFDSALTIFRTINDRGQPLSASDLLKVDLYDEIKDDPNYSSEKANEFLNRWNKTLTADSEELASVIDKDQIMYVLLDSYALDLKGRANYTGQFSLNIRDLRNKQRPIKDAYKKIREEALKDSPFDILDYVNQAYKVWQVASYLANEDRIREFNNVKVIRETNKKRSYLLIKDELKNLTIKYGITDGSDSNKELSWAADRQFLALFDTLGSLGYGRKSPYVLLATYFVLLQKVAKKYNCVLDDVLIRDYLTRFMRYYISSILGLVSVYGYADNKLEPVNIAFSIAMYKNLYDKHSFEQAIASLDPAKIFKTVQVTEEDKENKKEYLLKDSTNLTIPDTIGKLPTQQFLFKLIAYFKQTTSSAFEPFNLLPPVFDIEHIIPKKKDNRDGLKMIGKNISEEQVKEDILKIGNLLPLENYINSSIGNKSINKKLEAYVNSQFDLVKDFAKDLKRAYPNDSAGRYKYIITDRTETLKEELKQIHSLLSRGETIIKDLN
ncbi:GmrSD restriction endonuclease domain-containing protein, partial [Psittacicella hinzii]